MVTLWLLLSLWSVTNKLAARCGVGECQLVMDARARNRVNYQHESLHAVVSGLSVSAVFGVGLRLATVDAARSNSKGKQARYLIGKHNGKITSVSE